MNAFFDFNFKISYQNITRTIICNIDNICDKEMYTDDDFDIVYLIDNYNDEMLGLNKSLLYYCISSCIVNKFYYYGILHVKSSTLYKLFEDLSRRHIETNLNDTGLYYIFEGLIKYDLNRTYGLEKIKTGVDLLNVNNNNIYLSGDFLYGANLIKKIPDDFVQLNIDYHNNLNNNFILESDNIETIICKKFDYTEVYINFTTDVIYFLSFAISFLEIIKNLHENENIKNVGFFWNIIIDKSSYNNKTLMNDFIVKSHSLFEYFKEKNSIIITRQIFDVDITDTSLFTTYRFINMYKYLQISKKPIIQSDIDFDNLINLNQFIDKIKGYDIGLFRVKSTPWRKICATLSYFSNEKETLKFTYIFGAFLNYFYNSTSNNWFIDQLCLSLTENYLNCTLNAETNICSIYKYSKNVFNYSTLYKNQMLDEYKKNVISHHSECMNI